MEQSSINRVAFFGRSKAPEPARELLAAAAALAADGKEVFFAEQLAAHCGKSDIAAAKVNVRPSADIRRADTAFVLGGDGTFLRAGRHCAPLNIPLTGINLGYLGFLTDVAREDMRDEIMAICRGECMQERRFMLSARAEREGKELQMEDSVALNDIVVSRGEGGFLLAVRVRINGALAFDLRADGLIVATPSGSTAYALSAGGPIIAPDLRCVLLAPLCAHALSHRPLAVNAARADIELEILKSRKARLYLDGQNSAPLSDGDIVRVRRHPKPLIIRHPLSYDYYKTLRQKLSWGG